MITVLYSSWWWNTRTVVEYIAQECSSYDFVIKSITSVTKEDLNASDVVVLAAPTYDHWVLHKPYERFLDAAKDVVLNRSYVVIWLWDNKYDNEYNVESAPILEWFIKNHWGSLLCDSLKINKNPINQLDTLVKSRVETQFLPSLPKA